MQPQLEVYQVTLHNLTDPELPDLVLATAFFQKSQAYAFAKDKLKLFNQYTGYQINTFWIGDADKNPAYQLWELIKQAKIESEED
jgi:hypothetical protein